MSVSIATPSFSFPSHLLMLELIYCTINLYVRFKFGLIVFDDNNPILILENSLSCQSYENIRLDDSSIKTLLLFICVLVQIIYPSMNNIHDERLSF